MRNGLEVGYVRKILIGVLAGAWTGAALVAAAPQAETERIAIPTLEERLDSGAEFLLIDVREDWELDENGAIDGAIHIPMGELEARMPDIPRDVPLVFY